MSSPRVVVVVVVGSEFVESKSSLHNTCHTGVLGDEGDPVRDVCKEVLTCTTCDAWLDATGP